MSGRTQSPRLRQLCRELRREIARAKLKLDEHLRAIRRTEKTLVPAELERQVIADFEQVLRLYRASTIEQLEAAKNK
jgi:hypothetical protein